MSYSDSTERQNLLYALGVLHGQRTWCANYSFLSSALLGAMASDNSPASLTAFAVTTCSGDGFSRAELKDSILIHDEFVAQIRTGLNVHEAINAAQRCELVKEAFERCQRAEAQRIAEGGAA